LFDETEVSKDRKIPVKPRAPRAARKQKHLREAVDDAIENHGDKQVVCRGTPALSMLPKKSLACERLRQEILDEQRAKTATYVEFVRAMEKAYLDSKKRFNFYEREPKTINYPYHIGKYLVNDNFFSEQV